MNITHVFGLLVLLLLVFITSCGQKLTPSTPTAAPVSVISSLPFHITNAGSYRLEKNLVGHPDDFGILIKTNNVVLDLNGKELRGVPRSSAGIIIGKLIQNVTVMNGTIVTWGHNAITAPEAHNCIYSNLVVVSNGMGISVGSSNTFIDCTISGTKAISLNSADRTVLKNCRSFGNNDDGFMIGYQSVVENCESSSNRVNGFYGIQGVTFKNCKAIGNKRSGFLAGASTTMVQCEAIANQYEGLELASGTMVQHCLALSNLNNGIHVFGHSTVVSNKAIGNQRDGIRIVFNNRVIDNLCEGNAFAGGDTSAIHPILKLNRIERNEIIIGKAIGIKASMAPNQILQNVVRHTLPEGGMGYDCKKENLAVPIVQREKAPNDPPTTNYELLMPLVKTP